MTAVGSPWSSATMLDIVDVEQQTLEPPTIPFVTGCHPGRLPFNTDQVVSR